MTAHRTTRNQPPTSTLPTPVPEPELAPEPASASARRPPRRGDRIGRFTVLDVLGRGGMGRVLSAYDPNLDRRVALKLVRCRSMAGDCEDNTARLMSEARAMARLRHPNVLTIYEVSEDDGRVFMAMEQVEGGSLRDRQARLRRNQASPWRAIVDLYVAAGRGLAAAHAAGIVHRDFKPDNVLVNREGEVRVADFGLSRALERPRRVANGTQPTRIPTVRESNGQGTPGYISSEQYLGRPVDARADQFAFCVALWEALYEELPFAGENEFEYATAVVAGQVRAPARERDVPVWIRRILERGLRADPAQRYPSMQALLAELWCDDPPAMRGRRTVAMVALTALFTILGVYPSFVEGDRGVGGVAISIAIALAGLLAVAGALRGRQRLSATNRRLFAVLFTPMAMSLAATGGAAMLGLDGDQTCMLLLLLWSALAATVAACLGVWLWIAAAGYAAAFVVASLAPAGLHFAIAAAHFTLMLNAIAIWGRRPAAQGKTGSGSKFTP